MSTIFYGGNFQTTGSRSKLDTWQHGCQTSQWIVYLTGNIHRARCLDVKAMRLTMHTVFLIIKTVISAHGKLSKTLTWKDELTTNWRARWPSKAHENVAWYIAYASLVGSLLSQQVLVRLFEWSLNSLSSLVSCGQRIGCDRLDKYDHQQPVHSKSMMRTNHQLFIMAVIQPFNTFRISFPLAIHLQTRSSLFIHKHRKDHHACGHVQQRPTSENLHKRKV